MVAKAGELAAETGELICQRCGEHIPVIEGKSIPRCQNCAYDLYVGEGISFGKPLTQDRTSSRDSTRL